MPTTYRSFAKINLSLRVLARRPDGYHELDTVFQSIALADLITLKKTRTAGVALSVPGGEVPAGSGNLAHRAATLFRERWAPELGVEIELVKRIPVGGGLGGGSSNAACVLRALQELFGQPANDDELLEAAADLGADVPYFLVGGTVSGRGRGDLLTPLEDLPSRRVVLATPPVAISTAEVFAAFDSLPLQSAAPEEESVQAFDGDWGALASGVNDLESVVFERFPIVGDVYNALVEAGAFAVRLSGTGATVFAFFGETDAPPELAAQLPTGCRIEQSRTLTRSSLDEHRVVR